MEYILDSYNRIYIINNMFLGYNDGFLLIKISDIIGLSTSDEYYNVQTLKGMYIFKDINNSFLPVYEKLLGLFRINITSEDYKYKN